MTTDAMVNAALAALPTAGKLYFVMIVENEASVDVTDVWADLTQVGTQVLNRTSLTCANRQIDCGAALVFDTVTSGVVRAIAVLTKAPASGPALWAVMDVDGGASYEMDSFGPLAVDSLILKWAYQGET